MAENEIAAWLTGSAIGTGLFAYLFRVAKHAVAGVIAWRQESAAMTTELAALARRVERIEANLTTHEQAAHAARGRLHERIDELGRSVGELKGRVTELAR